MKKKRRKYLITFYTTIGAFAILVGTGLFYLSLAYDIPFLGELTFRDKLSPNKKVDSDKPTIRLFGFPKMILQINGKFVDLGAEAFDSEGNPLEIIVTGYVDTTKPGVYVITYTARDKHNNVVKVERTVTVPAPITPNSYIDLNIINLNVLGKEKDDSFIVSSDGKSLAFNLTFGYDLNNKIIKFKIENTGNMKVQLKDLVIENNPLPSTGINILWPDFNNKVLNPGEISEEYVISISVGDEGTRKANNIKAYLNYIEYIE